MTLPLPNSQIEAIIASAFRLAFDNDRAEVLVAQVDGNRLLTRMARRRFGNRAKHARVHDGLDFLRNADRDPAAGSPLPVARAGRAAGAATMAAWQEPGSDA